MSDLTTERLDQIEKVAKNVREALGSRWLPAAGFASNFGESASLYLANTDPATTLALIKRVRELEACIAAVRTIIGPRENLDPNQGGCEGWADETLLAILDALGDES